MKKGIDHVGVTITFFCHDGKGNFLMSKRTNRTRDEHGKWELGGGGVNFKEPVIKALKREIKEEYSTNVKKIEFLGYRDIHRLDEKKRETHWIGLDFKVLVNRKKVKIGEPKKIEEIRWISLNNLPKPQHSQFQVFLRKYKSQLK